MPRDVSFVFDPFEIAGVDKASIPPEERDKVLDQVAELVLEQVKQDTSKGISPVYGDKFDALSPLYKKKKTASGRPGIPNLRFDGDMMDAIEIQKQGEVLKIFVADDQSDKADGHNNHSGESSLPLRRFIPKDEDDGWSDKINKKITKVVKEAQESTQPQGEDDLNEELRRVVRESGAKSLADFVSDNTTIKLIRTLK